MAENIIIGLLTGLIAGLVTGLYSGLIVSRVVRFNGLISDSLRALNSVEYMSEVQGATIRRNHFPEIQGIASVLSHFGHKESGKRLRTEQNKLMSVMFEAEQGRVTVQELDRQISSSYEAIRQAKPSWRILLPLGTA